MSLIEEALRKQREESEKSGGTPVTPPPLPSVEPEPAQEEPQAAEEPARRPWALLAIIAGGSLIAILVVVWLLVYGLKLWQTKPETVQINSIAATSTPAAPAPSSPSVQSNVPAKAAATTTTTPSVQVAAIAAPAPTEVAPAQPVTQPAPVINTPPPATQVAEKAPLPAPVPAPAKLELPVVWPKIAVSGIIGSTKSGRSAAILNGQMLSPGDTIEGATIEAIDKQKVKLKFGGELKSLAVGASTE